MLIELLKSVVVRSLQATDGGANGPVVFTSTGAKYIFTAVAPVRLLKWGFLASNVAIAQTASAMQLTLSSLPAPGGSLTQIDTLTTVAASAYALGFGAYRETFAASVANVLTPPSEIPQAGPIGSQPNVINAGQTQFTLSVGQQWSIGVGVASDNTGQGLIFLEYVLLPIAKPSGYGVTNAGTVSLTDNYTQLAS